MEKGIDAARLDGRIINKIKFGGIMFQTRYGMVFSGYTFSTSIPPFQVIGKIVYNINPHDSYAFWKAHEFNIYKPEVGQNRGRGRELKSVEYIDKDNISQIKAIEDFTARLRHRLEHDVLYFQ